MFGWIDFSDEERRRTSEIMNLARYPGAIDELGFGILRDAFADKLFPATSTLHTHARYYYLISYLMKDIERLGCGRSLEQLQTMLQDGEIRTCRRLVAWSKQQTVPVSGITGSDSLDSGWVKMTPAFMDWAAIQRLKLFRDPEMKLRGFLRSVSATSKTDFASLRPEELYESTTDYSYGSLWDVPYSVYETWDEGDELSLSLDPVEAEDLKNRIVRYFPNTAYAAIVNCKSASKSDKTLRDSIYTSDSFIDLVESGALKAIGCNPKLLALCETAADLSSFVSLLHIRFNHVLRRKAEVTDFEIDDANTQWQRHAYDSSSVYHKRTAALNIDEAHRACSVSLTSGRNYETHRFLKAAQAAYLQEDLDTLDTLIERREKHLKGEHRSKIANAKAHADRWVGGIELTYRLNIALMVASEISSSLEANDD